MTPVELADDQAAALEELSRKENRSMSEIMRELVDKYLGSRPRTASNGRSTLPSPIEAEQTDRWSASAGL